MSEKLNKEIRAFFIKIGNDIKRAFDECSICCCSCCPKTRIHAQNVGDIENQITEDMNCLKTPDNINDRSNSIVIDGEEYKLDDNVIVEVNTPDYIEDIIDEDLQGYENIYEENEDNYEDDDFVIIY
jgi:hypothetical protein